MTDVENINVNEKLNRDSLRMRVQVKEVAIERKSMRKETNGSHAHDN